MEFNQNYIQRTIGYSFRNLHLLGQAFTRKSFSNENGGQNNEVLEFVGDKVLDLVVVKSLAEHFGVMTEDKQWNEFKLRNPHYFQTKSKEGAFTDIKKELVQKKALAHAIDDLGFAQFMFLGKGEKLNNLSDSAKEGLFEAILGAVAIDCEWDFDTLIHVTKCMIDIDGFLNNDFVDSNYVGSVQEWYSKEYGTLPDYDIRDYYDGFYCYLRIGYESFEGKGSSKPKARMACAEEAYWYLKENGYIKDSIEDYIDNYDETNSLRILNELYQKGFINKPDYLLKDEPNGDTIFWNCTLTIKDIKKKTKGVGTSKKEAQRIAALKMLDYLSSR